MLQVDKARVCLQQAQKHWQAQEWQETIQTCAQALAYNQKLPQAHKLMGDALQKTDKQKEAIGYYHEAIKLQPNFTEVYANLGTVYVQQQEYQLAINCYQQALKIDPNFTAVGKHLAKATLLLEQQGNHRNDHPTQPSASNELNLDDHLQQGDNLQHRGELQAALEQYLAAARLRPQRIETYQEIIKLYEKLGLWADAAKYCRLIFRLTKNNTSVVAQSSLISSENSEFTEEEEITPTVDFAPSLATQPTFPDSANYLAQGHSYVQQEDYKSAISCYRQAIKQQPQLIDAYLALGDLVSKLGQSEQAINCYLSGLKQQQHPKLYFALGNLYQVKEKWSRAALCYQKTVEYDSHHSRACHELGEVLSKQQQWTEAIKAYEKAIAIEPDFSWSHHNLGYALIQLNRWSEAIPAYQKAIALKSDFPWSYYNLAEAHGKLGQWTEAIFNYQQAAQLQPDLSQVQQKLGDAYYRRSEQDRQRALDGFLLAIGQDPDNPEVYHQALAIDKHNITLYLKLGDILAESGKTDQALVTYQMALQAQPKNIEVLNKIQQYQGDSPLLPLIKANIPADAPVATDYQALVAELQSILPHSDSPEVSIIIPVYNQLDYTLRCLKAIALNLDQSIPVEVILVNDCSTDQTKEILEPLTVVNLINQPTNQGFIYACNQGAAAAQGKYLYFLNNDTEIKPNSITSLMQVLEEDQEVGAVGSKLVYPQGSLQEAGGIIWQDGSGWNYGRQENPYAPEYNYLRPVDYCSGASLMVRTEVFDRLDGFERDFAPAYYEDTNLCFAIRHQLGMKVMYQPKSEVIHYEGISSGTSVASGTKKYQAINAIKFRQKWQANLAKDYLPNKGVDHVPSAARKYLCRQTILVIDSYMPSYDRESGSRRLFELLKIFKRLNYHVIFAADNGVKEEPYASVLQNLQIEVLYTQDGYGKAIEEQIQSRLDLIDLAWICRPELNQKYAPIVRQDSTISIIYDTIDLHYLRLKRAREIDPTHCTKEQWVEMQTQELKMAHLADLTITVTATEQKILEAQGVEQVAVVPNIHLPYKGQIPDFEQRQGILFIGSYNHLPNVDAVLWLCTEIMPLVWKINPEIHVTLLGSNPSAEVLALASDHITVTGYIDDVSSYFLSHKLSVSPLRYGAGMKGKIGQSLEYSLPVVSTKIGTEGMNLVSEQQILEADHALNFAQQILRLYTDVNLWNLLANNSQDAIKSYSTSVVEEQLSHILDTVVSEHM